MNGKRLLTIALLAFALFFIVTQPVEAATILREGAEGAARIAETTFDAFSTFLSTLF